MAEAANSCFVVTRYRVTDGPAFRARAEGALEAFAGCAGFVSGRVGRNIDEADLWSLSVEFADVGSYRRALGSYAVKVAAVPVMYEALDEPSAYEVLAHTEGSPDRRRGSDRAADADSVGLGEASAPVVPSDLEP